MEAGSRKKTAYVLIAALMMLLFNFPVLSAVNKGRFVAALPVMYVYLFVVWISAIIVLLLLTAYRRNKNRKGI